MSVLSILVPPPLPVTDRVEVRTGPSGQKGVYATRGIPAGGVVLELSPVFRAAPERHSVQLGPERHQAFTNEADDYLNHSCHPNARVHGDALLVLAVADIAPGEEVTFDYSSSEWDMAEPFVCTCDGRARLVRGYKHLSATEWAEIAHLVPAWLAARLIY